ncbi:hypothetical protein [Salibacterium lacus]|uniref:Uncharacterized protein n=1 Tax=Salibacterium lacus TaxID=1898109 RepID=A0ABW5T3H6_9BACI
MPRQLNKTLPQCRGRRDSLKTEGLLEKDITTGFFNPVKNIFPLREKPKIAINHIAMWNGGRRC